MSHIGDFRLGDTFDTKFCTVSTTGAPTTLAGTPVISAYVGNSLTQITAGITLTVDFDAVTGLHNVRVVASGANGYATASNYQLVITTGTVGGTSVVGYVIAEFSIEARSALIPTTAARTLDVSATGEADANVTQWLGTAAAAPTVAGVPEVDLTHIVGTAHGSTQIRANVVQIDGSANGVTALQRSANSIVRITVGAASTTTSVVSSSTLPAGAAADQFKGRIMIFDANTTTTALRGQATDITASTNAADPTYTVTALTTAPVSGDTAVLV